MKPIAVSITAILFLLACSKGPYSSSNRQSIKKAREFSRLLKKHPENIGITDSTKLSTGWVLTPNFNMRRPNYVVLHHTAQSSCEQTLKTFSKEQTQVSAHYVICKDGTLYHLLNDHFRAWHAGAGKWGNETDLNSSSIGIEIDNNGTEAFSSIQVDVLTGLLAYLKKTYIIPAANFIGHGDIAPGRKVDPNVHFPWKELAEKGFGLWYGDTSNITIPVNFNSMQALRIIGYDVSNQPATIQAFRRHFLQTEITGELTEPEKKVLYSVMLKYM